MKGQYLAVETVFVFGLGLMVAIGVITLFNQFRMGVLDDAEPQQAQIINSHIRDALNTLKQSDKGTKYSTAVYDVELPDKLAGSDYTIQLTSEATVITVGGDSYRRSLNGLNDYSVSGSARGGDVTVFKQGTQLEIRD